MNYLDLFTMPNLALVSDWLAKTGELYVDIYLPHSGGGSDEFFIRSMEQLKALIAKQTHPEIDITVFRLVQYPLRGIANEDLLEKALEEITDGVWFNIIYMDANSYPGQLSYGGSGDSHSELSQQITELFGTYVAVGVDFNSYIDYGKILPPDAFRVRYIRASGWVIHRNQQEYESYSQAPERYAWLETLWQH